ncbi:uncharacterized protein K441DRAFT_650480 [Cenococcum geophilum 1.58]|uniref:uncharacterized protein n=1 Tax=Cenococcum geophilum 1.58 TaxID=794803 RepID=UPI00358F8561|nr:hypothetical protein K441DRAFT_650480 [Cenococcum geophilum 1.58]
MSQEVFSPSKGLRSRLPCIPDAISNTLSSPTVTPPTKCSRRFSHLLILDIYPLAHFSVAENEQIMAEKRLRDRTARPNASYLSRKIAQDIATLHPSTPGLTWHDIPAIEEAEITFTDPRARYCVSTIEFGEQGKKVENCPNRNGQRRLEWRTREGGVLGGSEFERWVSQERKIQSKLRNQELEQNTEEERRRRENARMKKARFWEARVGVDKEKRKARRKERLKMPK